ncbi:unnamed protein product [Diabrotica balteata]|uniref:C2H2-type domain-containing protein n=1 Tax=Diabrotica balteata TaxID=107213 RepID=A0A9N9SXL3_DIABA|nr:unnamed protein product [Diabrotica balteata]
MDGLVYLSICTLFLTTSLLDPITATASCQTCGKIFKNVNSLRAHMSLDCMKTSFFTCKACPFTSKRRFNMKMHYATKHKIEVPSGHLTKVTKIEID